VNDPSGSGAGRRAGRSPQSRTSALLGVLERRSRLAGDVRAVVDARGEGLTYGQWYEGALRTVRASQREASEGASVILLGERDDLLMPPVFVGSVASGRLTGLVSLRLSRSRIQAAISELGATVAFASERTISSLGWLGDLVPRLIETETMQAGATASSGAAPMVRDFAQSGCAVFSSGTTGSPRPTLCSVREVEWWCSGYRTLAARPFLTHFAFDSIGGLYGLGTAFRQAPVIRVAPLDVRAFGARVAAERPRELALLPVGVRLLMRAELALPDSARRQVTGIVISGAPSTSRELGFLHRTFPEATIRDVYASTEAGVISVARYPPIADIDSPGHDADPTLTRAGRIVRDVEVRIVDAADREVAPGELGRVTVRARHRRTRTTLGAGPGAHADAQSRPWAETGDLGLLDRNGVLYLGGRSTDVVRVGGDLVRAQEIEASLTAHADVEEAAVVGAADSILGEIVLAAVVRRGSVSARELQAHVRGELGAARTPARVIFVEGFPRVGGGKVDKASLSAQLADDR
jgi:acyl-coenzyme A synthetase/AMP-(fatty) acid ligase